MPVVHECPKGRAGPLNENESLSRELRLMLGKAREDISLASKIVDGGPYRVAASRAYYAAFYAMQAALLSMNITRSKHSGVISAFNLQFVKPGVFPSHFGALVSDLFRYRNIADYEFEHRIGEAEARSLIHAAEEIVAAITDYLVSKGLIDSSEDEVREH